MDSLRSFSNSELTTFRKCRRKWYIEYYLRLRPKGGEQVVGALRLGTRVHSALEAYYKGAIGNTDGLAGGLERALVALDVAKAEEEKVHADFLEEYGVQPFDLADVRKQHDLSLIMVNGYAHWVEETGADQGLSIIGVEEKIEMPGPVEGTSIRGKIDLVAHHDWYERFLILDHKTCASLDEPTLQIAPQMRIYAMIRRETSGVDGIIDGAWHNRLKKVKQTSRAKPPFYARAEVYFNEPELDLTKVKVFAQVREMLEIEDKLRSGIKVDEACYPSPNSDCSWSCNAFKTRLCPIMDDPRSDADWLIKNHYEPYDPLERYNEDDESLNDSADEVLG